MSEVNWKVDWSKIKAEYITGTDTSYRKLAEKYGIHESVITKRAVAEKWYPAKKKYNSELVAKAIAKSQKEEVNRLAKLQTAASSMADVIDKVFKDAQQFNRHTVVNKYIDEGGGMSIENEEKIFDKVDTRAIKDLTGAIKDLAAVMRDIYDIPTAGEVQAREIAAERLELEKKKASKDEQVDRDIHVVIQGYESEWSE